MRNKDTTKKEYHFALHLNEVIALCLGLDTMIKTYQRSESQQEEHQKVIEQATCFLEQLRPLNAKEGQGRNCVVKFSQEDIDLFHHCKQMYHDAIQDPTAIYQPLKNPGEVYFYLQQIEMFLSLAH